jgi:hypothetical protein
MDYGLLYSKRFDTSDRWFRLQKENSYEELETNGYRKTKPEVAKQQVG